MKLSHHRQLFTKAIGRLICFAYEHGYHLAIDCARCESDHHRINSVHKLGLAVDFNLYKDGELLDKGPEHSFLHDYWDTIGGAPRILKDMRHYSFEYKGRW